MDTNITATDVRLDIQKLHELPPLSAFATQFLAAVDDPDVEVRELAAILERDPALLARLVGMANSAYYGLREPVTSIEEAIFKVFGLRTTKSLALSIILSGAFDASGTPSFRLPEYWFTSIAAAMTAQRLAASVQRSLHPDMAAAYLCGLLHGIGELVLVHLYPGVMERVFERRTVRAEELVAIEREVAGIDHPQAGGWLARKWHLPAPVVAAVEHHHDNGYRGEYWPEVQLVGIGVAAAARLLAEEPLEPDAGRAEALGLGERELARAMGHLEASRDGIAAMARQLAV